MRFRSQEFLGAVRACARGRFNGSRSIGTLSGACAREAEVKTFDHRQTNRICIASIPRMGDTGNRNLALGWHRSFLASFKSKLCSER